MRRALPDVIELTRALVEVDSGVDDPSGVAKVEEILAGELADIDDSLVEWREEGGFRHLSITISGGAGRVALLGHADTVFPQGTAEERPMTVKGRMGYGPGVADMKGGLAMVVHVIRALVGMGDLPTIHLVVAGDEETRTVPPPFMDILSQADACMVLECGRPDGGFVVRRKGGMWLRLNAVGRSAHAGVEPDQGTSAIVGLCKAVVEVAALHRSRPDLTVSIGTIGGGSALNVVASEAWAEADVRSFDGAHLAWVRRAIDQACNTHGVVTEPLGDWPAMDPHERLASHYSQLGEAAAFALKGVATGGMSDGCWTASVGVPTIDGLGPEGGNDHSPEEFIDLETIPTRAGLLAGLIAATSTRGEEKR